MSDEKYWTYKAGSPTPGHAEAVASGAFNGTEAQWHGLSPGMRREIVRSHERQPRDYYVSIIRSTKQRGLLAGPFETHAQALDTVDVARREADRIDPATHFDAFGTCSLPRNPGNPAGVLNARLGIVPRCPVPVK